MGWPAAAQRGSTNTTCWRQKRPLPRARCQARRAGTARSDEQQVSHQKSTSRQGLPACPSQKGNHRYHKNKGGHGLHEIHDKLDKRINSRATGAEPTHWNTNKDGQAGRCSQQRQRGHGLFPEPQQPHVGQNTANQIAVRIPAVSRVSSTIRLAITIQGVFTNTNSKASRIKDQGSRIIRIP